MVYLTKEPEGFLAEFIDSYWNLETDPDLKSIMTERVIPDGTMQIIFHYGNPFINKRGKKEISQGRLIVCGQKKYFTDVCAPQGAGMIGVVFKPYGIRPFIRIPAEELTGNEITLSETMGIIGNELEDRLYHAGCFNDRIKTIEEFLLKRYSLPCRYSWGIARECVKEINSCHGVVSVPDLCDHFGVSPRNLERIFAAFIGVSPKFFIRVKRFNRAMILASSKNNGNLTTIALGCGYYDQSHFINESKNLSGMNPSDFLTNPCIQPVSEI